MSLRPEVYGFNKAKMFSFAGSKDESALTAMLEQIDESADPDNDEVEAHETAALAAAVKANLQDVVMNGLPNPRRESEGNAECYAAKILAEFEQDQWLDTESNFWKMRGLVDFAEEFDERFDPATKQLFEYLLYGRGIFGEVIDTDWSYYAYLSFDEVKTLRAGIKKVFDWAADLTDKGHLNEIDFSDWTLELMEAMLEWFDMIIEEELDLWFWAE